MLGSITHRTLLQVVDSAVGQHFGEGQQTLSVTAVVAGAIVGIYQYRLSVKAEQNQEVSSQAEADIRLSQAFATLMQTANGFGASQLSDQCVESIEKLHAPQTQDQLDNCVVSFPLGGPQQKAAIAAIGVLGEEYSVLRRPAIEGLNGLINEFQKKDPDGTYMAVAQRALAQIH
jgi:hypothetical protein